jgi:mono/diheme cytochrome c family protein
MRKAAKSGGRGGGPRGTVLANIAAMSYRTALLVPYALAVVACGEPVLTGESRPRVDCRTGTYLCPTKVYTGRSAGRTFKTIFWTSLAQPIWSLEDPSLGAIYPITPPTDAEPPAVSWAMVVTFMPGVTSVRAADGPDVMTANLVVQPYDDAAALDAGQARFYVPADPGGARTACADCHNGVSTGLDFGNDLTARQDLERFTDEEILAAIETGAFPDGRVLQGVDHRWDLTAAERAGIAPFLRSITPKAED